MYEDEDVNGYEDGVNPMCSMLYQYSGKCNEHLQPGNGYSSYAMYQSEAQQANEDAVCSFIDVVRSNTYNEKGQITFGFTNIFGGKRFRAGARAMSPGRKAALSIFGIGIAALIVAAMYLQRKLDERHISWRPRRFRRAGATDALIASEGAMA